MKFKIIGLIIFMFLIFITPVLSEPSLTKEEGRWSVVEYTESIYPGYPEYYPLIITIASQGRLPSDLIELTNYTNTVFISLYIISSNLSSIDSIIRYRDKDELVGEDPIEFKFEVSKEMAKGVRTIRFEVSLTPFNLTDILTDDIYNLEIEVKQEATGEDIIIQFIIVFSIPLFITISYYSQRHYNRSNVENVTYLRLPVYWCLTFKNSRYYNFIKSIMVAILIGLILSFTIYLLSEVYTRFLTRSV